MLHPTGYKGASRPGPTTSGYFWFIVVTNASFRHSLTCHSEQIKWARQVMRACRTLAACYSQRLHIDAEAGILDQGPAHSITPKTLCMRLSGLLFAAQCQLAQPSNATSAETQLAQLCWHIMVRQGACCCPNHEDTCLICTDLMVHS